MVIIAIGEMEFEMEVYDNPSAKALVAALPQKLSMSRWGGEYYGRLSVAIPSSGGMRDDYEVGEVAYWPPGNAFCIFFGPTPASAGDQPKMASAGVPLGKISSNAKELDKFGASLPKVILKLKA